MTSQTFIIKNVAYTSFLHNELIMTRYFSRIFKYKHFKTYISKYINNLQNLHEILDFFMTVNFKNQ